MQIALLSRGVPLSVTVFVFLLACLEATSASERHRRSVCPLGFCKTVECESIEPDQCQGVIKHRASVCGCCPVCVKQLGLGDFCFIAVPLGARTAAAECGEGLICSDNGRCVNEA